MVGLAPPCRPKAGRPLDVLRWSDKLEARTGSAVPPWLGGWVKIARGSAMKASILKLLLQSHADRDETSFRKAALQLAAAESNAGHVRVADEIRTMIAKLPATGTRKPGPVVDIATPRGEFADNLESGHRSSGLG